MMHFLAIVSAAFVAFMCICAVCWVCYREDRRPTFDPPDEVPWVYLTPSQKRRARQFVNAMLNLDGKPK